MKVSRLFFMGIVILIQSFSLRVSGQNIDYPQPIWHPDEIAFAVANGADIYIYSGSDFSNVDVLAGHSGDILALAWSPAGNRIASAGTDQTIRIWNFPVSSVEYILQGHGAAISELLWTPDGTRLISIDGTMGTNFFVWDTGTGNLLLTRDIGAAYEATFDATCNRLIYGTLANFFEVLDGETFSRIGAYTRLDSLTNGMLTVDVDESTGYFMTGSIDGSIWIWNPESLEPVQILIAAPGYQPDQVGILNPEEVNVRDIKITPNYQYLLAAVADGTLRVWDAGTYAELMTRQIEPLFATSFSPSGSKLVKVRPDFSVTVEDTSDLLPRLSIESRLISESSDRAGFHYRLTNNGNVPVNSIRLRVYFVPDLAYNANEYILNLYNDSTQSANVSGPFSTGVSSDPFFGMSPPHYFEIDYEGLDLQPGNSWQADVSLILSTSEVGFNATNDWWYTDITTTVSETSYLPVYASESLITGQTPTP